MSAASSTRQMNFATAFVLWLALFITACYLGNWLGFGGRRFAVTMAVFALLLAGDLFPAAPALREQIQNWLGARSLLLAPLLPLSVFVLYAASVTFSWKGALVGAVYAIAPSLLVLGARNRAAGTWEDYAAVVAVWLPVEFRWMYKLFAFPPPLTHTLTILLALNVGLAAFLFVRRLEGIGYSVAWGRGYAFQVCFNFIVFAAIVVPLGERIGFLTFSLSQDRLKSLPITALGILFFTAWPEEFLFRGLLQNLLTRTLKSQSAGLLLASVIFGFSHILHAPFPNWKYVLLATIAGFFYGRTWMKTGSIFASTLVHALVDILWHLLFR